MKITIVGSSHGVPEPGRKCSCILLEAGGNSYFIDMGTSGMDALRSRGIHPDAVRGIFITHMHGDHINGLVEFADLITWYFKTADPLICLPDPGAGAVIRDWLRITLNKEKKELRFRKTEPGPVYDDGVLRVTAIPTRHCPHSFAYLAEADGKRVLFTGDLQDPEVDFPYPEVDSPPDLLICEAAHFEASHYLPVLKRCPVHRVCVNHYSDRFLPGVLSLCDTLSAQGIPAVRAWDGLEITL